MRPVWVDIEAAIAHNRGVMQRLEATMGLSIQRETFMLEELLDDLAKAADSGPPCIAPGRRAAHARSAALLFAQVRNPSNIKASLPSKRARHWLSAQSARCAQVMSWTQYSGAVRWSSALSGRVSLRQPLFRRQHR